MSFPDAGDCRCDRRAQSFRTTSKPNVPSSALSSVHNDAFNLAAQVIGGNDFYRDAHRRIFDKMVALNERHDAIDFVTLKEELAKAGQLDEVGSPAYIASLADGVPRATNVEYYARSLKRSTLRNLIYAANKILTNAYEADQDSDIVLDDADQRSLPLPTTG